MLCDTKLVKKNFQNQQKNFPPYIISSETFFVEGIGNFHSLFTFDFVFMHELYHFFSHNYERLIKFIKL